MLKGIFICLILLIHPLTLRSKLPETIEEKIGQMIIVGFRGYSLDEAPWLKEQVSKGVVGGVILFDWDKESAQFRRNIKNPAQLKKLNLELQKSSPFPLIIAIDQEGGLVNRLHPRYGFPETKTQAELGSNASPDEMLRHAEIMAVTLAENHINLNLAPVVDLNLNREGPIGKKGRCFSSDPMQTTLYASISLHAMHRHGVKGTLKHFPGHGSSADDTHDGFVDITRFWSIIEMSAFRYLIEEGFADAVMVAHVFHSQMDKSLPLSLSPFAIQEKLRHDLQFDGIVITDDLQMKAITEHYHFEESVRLAVLAGVDLLLFANQEIYDPDVAPKIIAIIKEMLLEGSISEDRIEESFQRILKLKNF